MKMLSKNRGQLLDQVDLCNQKFVQDPAPVAVSDSKLQKGITTLELLIALSIASGTAALSIEAYEHFEPIAQQVADHENAKMHAICNIRKFKACQ